MCNKFAIDLFSGAGGSTQAAKKYFNIVTAIELEPIYAKTYELNHSKEHLYIADVKTTDKDFWENQLKKISMELDLLIATPPCQGFSKHSRKKVIESDDIRNTLILEVIRIARITQPQFIFMENVTNIINYKIFHKFLKNLSNIKRDGMPIKSDFPSYHIRFESVNAEEFKVPQKRKRMILIAKKINSFPEKEAYVRTKNITVPKVTKPLQIWPKPQNAPFLGDYLSQFKLSPLKAGQRDLEDKLHRSQNLSSLNLERIQATPHNGGSRNSWPEKLILDCHKKERISFGDVYGRMSNYDYAPTITCGCTSYSKGRFGHPVEDRAISLREAALIQTFPFDYKFTGTIDGELYEGASNKIATQIGNAIPVKLAEAFFKEIYLHC
ncbi:DNA cytosine methyltransferase [Lysinibacillus fusiformis]|uniref:DNA cytosine methyltransferase n=1 Tax=Lysinibacillus fusiformis TaxID=28031 RepID=UPI0020BD81EB|nr:DNA (cytosine-5-)-methyltransferase [Lysinibacillus fusiformis]